MVYWALRENKRNYQTLKRNVETDESRLEPKAQILSQSAGCSVQNYYFLTMQRTIYKEEKCPKGFKKVSPNI